MPVMSMPYLIRERERGEINTLSFLTQKSQPVTVVTQTCNSQYSGLRQKERMSYRVRL